MTVLLVSYDKETENRGLETWLRPSCGGAQIVPAVGRLEAAREVWAQFLGFTEHARPGDIYL